MQLCEGQRHLEKAPAGDAQNLRVAGGLCTPHCAGEPKAGARQMDRWPSSSEETRTSTEGFILPLSSSPRNGALTRCLQPRLPGSASAGERRARGPAGRPVSPRSLGHHGWEREGPRLQAGVGPRSGARCPVSLCQPGAAPCRLGGASQRVDGGGGSQTWANSPQPDCGPARLEKGPVASRRDSGCVQAAGDPSPGLGRDTRTCPRWTEGLRTEPPTA